MSNYFKLDFTNTDLSIDDLNKYQKEVDEANATLMNGTGAGNDFLGWLTLPVDYDKEEVERIKKAAAKIRSNSKVLIPIGIGGSYLGLRFAYEFLRKTLTPDLELQFAGNNISGLYLTQLVEYVKDKDFSIIIISKSGTTTEPAIATRVLEDLLKEKYPNDYRDHIYCVTDKAKGACKTIADNNGYESFVIPDNIGGRFSVLTPVGLLGMAACGIDIDKVFEGAQRAMEETKSPVIAENEAYQYAVVRNLMLKEVPIELMVSYEPNLLYFNEWWKQLFGESEGKDGKGLFPCSVTFSTDLHSLGQYIQEGQRLFFETIIKVDHVANDITLGERAVDLDGLNYLAGKTMTEVNEKAFLGTLAAHKDGGVKEMVLTIPTFDEFTLGYLIYFFEKACGLSGYLLGVNPFNQPGVEYYKKNMFKLLGKPGY